MRDEVHRFAVSFHRQQRSKRMQRSRLAKIFGLRHYHQKQLLAIFRFIDYIRETTVESIAEVHGIGQKMPDQIHEYFHLKAMTNHYQTSIRQSKILRKKVLIPFILIIISVWIYDGVISPSYPWRYEKVEHNFHFLHQGMTKEQVIQLVGSPKQIRRFGTEKWRMTEEQWILHFRPKQIIIPVCTFQVNSELLIKAEMLTEPQLD